MRYLGSRLGRKEKFPRERGTALIKIKVAVWFIFQFPEGRGVVVKENKGAGLRVRGEGRRRGGWGEKERRSNEQLGA